VVVRARYTVLEGTGLTGVPIALHITPSTYLSGGQDPPIRRRQQICGGHGIEVPPVPIPNTEVKLNRADGTRG
jgi:hypothetical protein